MEPQIPYLIFSKKAQIKKMSFGLKIFKSSIAYSFHLLTPTSQTSSFTSSLTLIHQVFVYKIYVFLTLF